MKAYELLTSISPLRVRLSSQNYLQLKGDWSLEKNPSLSGAKETHFWKYLEVLAIDGLGYGSGRGYIYGSSDGSGQGKGYASDHGNNEYSTERIMRDVLDSPYQAELIYM